MSTIAIDPDVKESLKELKLAPEESYNSVVKRLISEVKKKKDYKPMFPQEEKQEQKESHIKDFNAWLEKKLVEDKNILDALGRK
jgi:predicted CopG family antitoxin